MTRDIRLFIEDILESISKVEEYTKELTEAQFLSNSQSRMRSYVAWRSSVRP